MSDRSRNPQTGPAVTVRPLAAETVHLPRVRGLRRLGGGGLRLGRALWHFARWRWRFGGFGWRSLVSSPDLLTNLRCVRIGRRVRIRKGARIEVVGPATGEVITIGDDTSIHLNFHVGAARQVRIGRNVLIAGQVYVTDHDHELPVPGRARGSGRTLQVAPTIIEDDCWLGEGCRILKGVRLGRGCVVGANAVVTKSFPAYSLVVGVPARLLRRYDEAKARWVSPGEGAS